MPSESAIPLVGVPHPQPSCKREVIFQLLAQPASLRPRQANQFQVVVVHVFKVRDLTHAHVHELLVVPVKVIAL